MVGAQELQTVGKRHSLQVSEELLLILTQKNLMIGIAGHTHTFQIGTVH